VTDRLEHDLNAMTAYQLRDLGDLRGALSGTAARRAAERCSAKAAARLDALAGSLAGARTASERYRAAGRFCVEVAAAAQSVRLAQLELELQITIGAMAWLTVNGAGRDAKTFHAEMSEGYRQLATAVGSGDPAGARDRAERNAERTTDRLVELHYRLLDRLP
jgi:DNA-binding FadR family transcriptional regulator